MVTVRSDVRVNLLERQENQRQARPSHAFKLAEKKYHTTLVLLEHAKGHDRVDRGRNDEKREGISAMASSRVVWSR
jgi:hypothetical protein